MNQEFEFKINPTPVPSPGQPRRGFIAAAAVVIGGLISIFPVFSGLLVFLDPLRRKSEGGQWIRITSLHAVPDDGVPRFFPVIVERRNDAWTRYLNEPVGAVYLVREPGQHEVRAFTATCPHAGCCVDYRADKNCFLCPCHTSAFNLKGERLLDISAVPPRDMDALEVQVDKRPGGAEEILVKYQTFITGIEEQIAKS